jgi:hypothetical protein
MLSMDRLAADGFVLLGDPLGDGSEILLVINTASESEATSTLSKALWSKSGILEIKSKQP